MRSIHNALHIARVGVLLGTHPHTAWFAVRHATHPGELLEAARSFSSAKQMERQHFGPRNHVDDGIDALRHTYAAALLSYGLVRKHGESVNDAVSFTVGVGRAYECDGNDEGETRNSALMDEHNNAIGAQLGAELAHASVAHQHVPLLAAVHAALAAGSLEVIAHGKRRASSARDLPPMHGTQH